MNYITTQNARRALRIGAAVLALVIACTLLTAELAYDCGRLLRLAVHDRSEQLAALHLRLIGLAPSAAPTLEAEPAVAPQPAPAAPVAPLPVAPMDGAPAAEALPSWTPQVVAACSAPAPAAGRQAPPLEGMTVHQLRRLAQGRGLRQIGGRKASKARRADLLVALA